LPHVVVSSSADHTLDKLPVDLAVRIIEVLKTLEITAYPRGAQRLQGTKNKYKIRVGNYRILYSIEQEVVLVYKISPREHAYD